MMETFELKQLMAEYNAKLDEIIHLNKKTALKNLQLKQTRKKTSSLLFYRISELVFFGIIVLFMGSFIGRHWNEPHLAISGFIVEFFALIALTGSIGQVILLQQIDYSKPIVQISKKIELINAHGFLFLKLILLSIPVWWAYAIIGLYLIFGFDIYPHLDPGFVFRYLVIDGLLIIPLLWFLNKLSYKNFHVKWVRRIIESLTSTKLKEALSSLKIIDQFGK